MNQHAYLHLIQKAEARLLRAITRMVGWQVELGTIPAGDALDMIEQHRREGMEIAQSTTDRARIRLHVTVEWTARAYERRAEEFRTQLRKGKK